ncbi:hypothetical protein [Thermofilum sp.]|uniref:hypothetical protein n=1 Tax=Thermofilum sp. TaxID=1961369 RepID=UPI0031674A99
MKGEEAKTKTRTRIIAEGAVAAALSVILRIFSRQYSGCRRAAPLAQPAWFHYSGFLSDTDCVLGLRSV